MIPIKFLRKIGNIGLLGSLISSKLHLLSLFFIENNTCVTPEEFRELITRIVNQLQYGDISIINDTAPPHWDVQGSIFFASTVVTTIGKCQLCLKF